MIDSQELKKLQQLAIDVRADIIKMLVDVGSGHSAGALGLVEVLLALYFWGAETLKHFTLLILLGTIIGTYSSIFVASPLLLMWYRMSEKK